MKDLRMVIRASLTSARKRTFSMALFVSLAVVWPAMAHQITDIQPRTFKRSTATTVRISVENTSGWLTQYEMFMNTKPTGWTLDQTSKQFWVNPNSIGYVEFTVTPPASGGTGSLGGLLKFNDFGTWKNVETATAPVTANEADISVYAFTFGPPRQAQGAHPDSVAFSYRNFGVNNMGGNTLRYQVYISKYSTFDGNATSIGYVDESDYTVVNQEQVTSFGAPALQKVTIPASASGNYYVFFSINHQSPSTLVDPDLSDNTTTQSGTISVGPAGTLQFKSATYSKAEDGSNVRLWVSRSGGSYGPAAVNFSTANGTASSGSDYTSQTGSLSWSDNDTTDKYFDVPILNDVASEGTETFTATLAGAVGARLGTPSTTTVSITDDEPRGSISIGGYDTGGGEDIKFVRIWATRANGKSGAVSVDYATANGTATAPGDYTAKQGTLTWENGESGDKAVDVPVVRDSLIEGTETFRFSISNISGADVGSPTEMDVKILDYEGVIRLSDSSYTVNEGDGTFRVYIERVEGARTYTEVNVVAESGTAVWWDDFSRVSDEGYVSWAAGETGAKYVEFSVNDDSLNEGSEAFTVWLQKNMYTVGDIVSPSSADVTIVDNDNLRGTLQLTQAEYAAGEGIGSVTIRVSRAGGSMGEAAVLYSTESGSAADPGDYTATNGTLSWGSGDAGEKTFLVRVVDDAIVEGDERFNVVLSQASGARLGTPSTASVLIRDNDTTTTSTSTSTSTSTTTTTSSTSTTAPKGALQFSASGYAVKEGVGMATVSVTRVSGSFGTATVQYATQGGTAIAGVDFVSTNGVLTWAHGDSGSKSVLVGILDDAVVESAKAFTVKLSGATGARLGTPTNTTVTIADDDAPAIGMDPWPTLNTQCDVGASPTNEILEVWNDGGGALSYWTVDAVPWLAVWPTNGTSTGAKNRHALTFSTAGLPVGVSTGLVTVVAPGSGNSPRILTVIVAVQTTTTTSTTSTTTTTTTSTTSTTSTTAPRQWAFPSGTPWSIPGWIESENYDHGGEGFAYHDLTSGNDGGAYRVGEGVDVEQWPNIYNGHAIGYMSAGEWLEYTVNVQSNGDYYLWFCLAAKGKNGRISIRMNEVEVVGTIAVPDTGGWDAWQWVRVPVSLRAGTQVLRLAMDANGASGFVCNLDCMSSEAVPPVHPCGANTISGSPWAIPGVIEVEDYDTCGRGVSWSDTTAGNSGGGYRPSEGVDVEPWPSAYNGYAVGYTVAGEWLAYSVNVAASGYHSIYVRVASDGLGGKAHLELDGVNVSGVRRVPNTGGWGAFKTGVLPNVWMPAGPHTIRAVMDENGPGGGVGNFDRLTFAFLAPTGIGQAPKTAVSEMAPLFVLTSDDDGERTNGWVLFDGDPETIWRGAADRDGWWVAAAYPESINWAGVDLTYVGTSWPGVQILGSTNGEDWSRVDRTWTSGTSAPAAYLWFLFPGAATNGVPMIRGIAPEPSF